MRFFSFVIKASEWLVWWDEILQLFSAVLQSYWSASSQYFFVVLKLTTHFSWLSTLLQEKNILPKLKRLKGLGKETDTTEYKMKKITE